MNHPLAVEYGVRERQEQLRTLAQASHAAHRARAQGSGTGIDRWRRRLAQALVTLGVIVGLRRERRRPAVADAIALLDRNCCLT